MPKTLPSRANVPAAATALPIAAATDAPTSWARPCEVLADEHRERHDHGDVDDRHRDRGLTELGEALPATHDDDAPERAHERVDGQLHGPGDDARDDRGEGRHEDGDARVEQHREQEPRGGRREQVRQDVAVAGEGEQERRREDREGEQHDRVVAMPEARAEAPHPGEQQPDDEDREEGPARQRRRVGREARGAEVLEREDRREARRRARSRGGAGAPRRGA